MQASRPAGVARSPLTLGSLVLVLSMVPSPAAAQTATPEPERLRALGPLAYPLEGTRWRLESYALDGEMRPVGPEVDAWLRIGMTDATGSTGCTRFTSGTRTSSPHGRPTEPIPTPAPFDGQVTFTNVEAGDRACAEQTMIVAGAVTDGLARTAGYRMEHGSPAWESRLELLDADAVPLLGYRVDDASSLEGQTWLLEEVSGAPALVGVDGQPATIAFDDAVRGADPERGSNVAGSTGCDGFSATFHTSGGVLSLGELVTAGDPCPPDLVQQDLAVRGILGASSVRMAFPPGGLVLTSDDDAGSLRYRAAAALEGGTWLLGRRDTARLGGSGITTLTLTPDPVTGPDAPERSGTISGEGPCRPYEGTYRSDGLLVEFEAIQPGRGRCATPGAEVGWGRILRRAAFAEVDRGRLRLRDRHGVVLATLDPPGLP